MEEIYNHRIFHELKGFSLAQKRLNESKEKLLELGSVICRHKLHKIVGISLLHKHFDLQPNERLVRKSIDNIHYVRPQIQESCDCLIPYLWKVGQNYSLGQWSYYPLEFVDITSIEVVGKDLSESVMKNQEFLSDMAAKLSDLGLTDIFGIIIVHPIVTGLDEEKSLFEMTNNHTRTNMCLLTSTKTLEQETATPTIWSFRLQKQYQSDCKKRNLFNFWEFFAQ